jgi:phytoene/squalene synthetase
MNDSSAALARSITWQGSKQAYYTARLMVDRDLVNDFYRAYAYFRWADDIVDVETTSHTERISFIKRQRALIDGLYRSRRPADLAPEEEIVADLIANDRGQDGWLKSFIHNMLAIVEFDAFRKGRLISQGELDWYTDRLGQSVTDGIQYFIGNGTPYPVTQHRCKGAMAAHVAHLLRDMLPDTADGFINIPREYLEAHRIGPEDINSDAFRAWVRDRVELAREYFRDGKRYLDQLEVLRCKLVAHWYIARFEGVLDTIEHDGYRLRPEYVERRRPATWLKFAWLGVSITGRHAAGG